MRGKPTSLPLAVPSASATCLLSAAMLSALSMESVTARPIDGAAAVLLGGCSIICT